MIDSRLGTRIIPSPENLAKQLKRYQFVQDNGNINPHSVVDLRYSNQVVVKAGN
jgi:cell division septal protein FtsQ